MRDAYVLENKLRLKRTYGRKRIALRQVRDVFTLREVRGKRVGELPACML